MVNLDIIKDLGITSIVRQNRSYENVRFVERLGYLNNIFENFLIVSNMLTIVQTELDFWEGVTQTLAISQISVEEQKIIMGQIEQTREYKRPNDELYSTALTLYKRMLSKYSWFTGVIRDISVDNEFFEHYKNKYYNQKDKDEVCLKWVNEYGIDRINEMKQISKEYEDNFYTFLNEKFDDDSNETPNPKPDEARSLLDWYLPPDDDLSDS